MSSLYLKKTCLGYLSFLTLAIWAGLLAEQATAAEGYVVPRISLGDVYQTNIGMVPSGAITPKLSANGYSADASVILGLKGPRSSIAVQPRYSVIDYPSHKELKQADQYLDLNNVYSTQRADWELVGNYYKLSTITAQQTSATYNEFDPNDPTVDSTGTVRFVSETRSRAQLRPKFAYQFSERIGTELKATYQISRADLVSNSNSQDYDYLAGVGELTWRLGQTTKLGTGFNVTEYKSGDGTGRTKSNGLTLDLTRRWTPTLSGWVGGNVDQVTYEDLTGLTPDVKVTKWGAAAQLISTGQISRWRLDIGRSFSPSSSGSRAVLDQFRVQYNHNITQRMSFVAAVRAFRSRKDVPEGTVSSSNRDYASGNFGLTWSLTRTWFVSGYYAPYWQKLVDANQAAAINQTVGISFGYAGLPPQR